MKEELRRRVGLVSDFDGSVGGGAYGAGLSGSGAGAGGRYFDFLGAGREFDDAEARGGFALGVHLADLTELAITVLDEVVDFTPPKVADGFNEIFFQIVGGFVGIAVGTAKRFINNLVDGVEFE